MPDNEYEILIRLDQRVGDMHTQLLGEDGRIPKVEEKVDKHAAQINYWRGAVAFIAAVVVAFGGIFLAHILGGK